MLNSAAPGVVQVCCRTYGTSCHDKMLPATAHRTLARIFSRPVLRGLADGRLGDISKHALRCLADAGEDIRTPEAMFNVAYRELSTGYRNEYIYKNTIANKLIFGRHSPATASLLSEFRANESIADTVIINGTSTVYEIKTEYDSLARLPMQLSDYAKVFDKIYVVTHARASKAVEQLQFPHVGILLLSSRGTLQVQREATSNIENLDLRALFMSLRRTEFTEILQRHGRLPDAGPATFWSACQDEFARLPKIVAHTEAVAQLRQRTTGSEEVLFLRQLPAPLKLLGFAEPFSRPRRLSLLRNLQAPLSEFS